MCKYPRQQSLLELAQFKHFLSVESMWLERPLEDDCAVERSFLLLERHDYELLIATSATVHRWDVHGMQSRQTAAVRGQGKAYTYRWKGKRGRG